MSPASAREACLMSNLTFFAVTLVQLSPPREAWRADWLSLLRLNQTHVFQNWETDPAFLALPFPGVSSVLFPLGSHLLSSAVPQTWHSLLAETIPKLNRAKTLFYIFFCTCGNMRFIFFTIAWHSRLTFNNQSTRAFNIFIDLFICRADPSLAFGLWTSSFQIALNCIFFLFFTRTYLKYINPIEACPQPHWGAHSLLMSINAPVSFPSPSSCCPAQDSEQSQGHSSLPLSPSWSKLPFW